MEKQEVLGRLKAMLDSSEYNDSVQWNPNGDTECLKAAIAWIEGQEETAEVKQLREENQGLASALEAAREQLEAVLECRKKEKAQARHMQTELQGFIEVLQKAITAQAVELAGYMGEAGVVPE